MSGKLAQQQQPESWTLLYDGKCGFCASQSARFLRMTKRHDIKQIDFHQPGVLDRFPNVTTAMCDRGMQLISPEGRIYSGAAAVAEGIKHRPVLRIFSSCYKLPILKQLIDISYWLIAKIRFWLPGSTQCDESGSCRVE